MKYSFNSAEPIPEMCKRFTALTKPWRQPHLSAKNTRAGRLRGTRFLLSVNLSNGASHPKQILRGRFTGSGVTARFGMSRAVRLLVGLPSTVLAAVAVWGSFEFDIYSTLILWLAAVLCSAVLIGFASFMSRTLGADERTAALEFIQKQVILGLSEDGEERAENE